MLGNVRPANQEFATAMSQRVRSVPAARVPGLPLVDAFAPTSYGAKGWHRPVQVLVRGGYVRLTLDRSAPSGTVSAVSGLRPDNCAEFGGRLVSVSATRRHLLQMRVTATIPTPNARFEKHHPGSSAWSPPV